MATLTLTKTPATPTSATHAPDYAALQAVTRTGLYYTRDGRTALTVRYVPGTAQRDSNPNALGALYITARNLPGFRNYSYPTPTELRNIADDLLSTIGAKRAGRVIPLRGWNVTYPVERA